MGDFYLMGFGFFVVVVGAWLIRREWMNLLNFQFNHLKSLLQILNYNFKTSGLIHDRTRNTMDQEKITESKQRVKKNIAIQS